MKEYWSGLGKITFFRKISEVKRGANSLCVQENRVYWTTLFFARFFVHFFLSGSSLAVFLSAFLCDFLSEFFLDFLSDYLPNSLFNFLSDYFCPISCRFFVRFSCSLSGSLSSSPVGNFSSGNTSSTFNFSEGFARSRQFRAISVLPS